MKNLLVIFSVFCIGVLFGADFANADSVSKGRVIVPEWLKEYQRSFNLPGRQTAFYYMLDVMGRDKAEEAGVADSVVLDIISQVLDHPDALVKLEGIYILKHWSALPQRLYKKLAELAVSGDTSTLQTEAFATLEKFSTSVTFKFYVQRILAKALTDPFVGYRKKAYRILSAQELLGPLVTKNLHDAIVREHYLKPIVVLTPEIMRFIKSQLLKGSPSFVRNTLNVLSNIESSNKQLSPFLASLLKEDLSHVQLSQLIEVMNTLRVLDSHTIPLLLGMLSDLNLRKHHWRILRVIEHSPVSWYNSVFEHLKGIILSFNEKDQRTTYYLMQKMLWQHPQVRQNIKAIIRSYEPIHIELRNLLFHHRNRYKVAGLYLLSELQFLSHDVIKEYLLDSVYDKFQFKNVMALLAIEQLPAIIQDSDVQKSLIKKVTDKSTEVLFRTFIMRVIEHSKMVDLSVLQDVLYLALFDTYPSVRVSATYTLGRMADAKHLLEFRHSVVDIFINLLKNNFTGIRKTDIREWGKAYLSQVDVGKVQSTQGLGQELGSKKELSGFEWKAFVLSLGKLDVREPKVWQAIAQFLDTEKIEHQIVAYSVLKDLQPTDIAIMQKMQTLAPYLEVAEEAQIQKQKQTEAQMFKTGGDDVDTCKGVFR